MTIPDHDKLAARYIEISDELTALARARGASDSITVDELKLRTEQDEIEYLLGVSRERREPAC